VVETRWRGGRGRLLLGHRAEPHLEALHHSGCDVSGQALTLES